VSFFLLRYLSFGLNRVNTMTPNYDSLKVEKHKLMKLLDANKNLRGHDSYKMAEQKLADVRKKIKALFTPRDLE
jgi:hypothetical protein